MSPATAPAHLDVVTFGEILWDIYEGEPRRKGETIARLLRSELGGAPANVAIGLARLGMRAAVCGGIGHDAFGQSMRVALEAEGVDPSLTITLPERTGLTFVRRDARGEPSFLFYRHQTADVSVSSRDLPKSLRGASWLLVGSSTWMTAKQRNTTRALMSHANRGGAAIVVDLNVRAHMWRGPSEMRERIATLAGRADLLRASDTDLAAVTSDGDGSDWLATHAPNATWLITRGAKSATASGAHGDVSLPANARDAVDATGAGDAFLAGVLATLVRAGARPGSAAWKDKAVFTEALSIGHAMGAKAVSAAGAVAGLTNLEPLRARLDQMSKSTSSTKSSNRANLRDR